MLPKSMLPKWIVCVVVLVLAVLNADTVQAHRHGSKPPNGSKHPSGSKTPNDSKPPNIVLFLVDDLGYGDLGFMGHPSSQTPEIDKLAGESKIFTQFYVASPVCSPSRAALLTGRYQVRSGIYPYVIDTDNPQGLPTNETTIAKILKKQGYRTLITGKWHLGVGYDGEYLPAHHGFDDYLGLPYSHDMCPCCVCYPDDKACWNTCWPTMVSCALFSNTTIIEQPTPLTGLENKLLTKATKFLLESKISRDPFFLYYAFHHVHAPQFSGPDFEGKSSRELFGDSLLELDHSVGSILRTLDLLDLADDTIVWFLSDNGPDLTADVRGGSAGPLRCGKFTTWEGGLRVPATVRWPGRIEPGRTDALLSSLDLLPTISAMTGGDITGLTLDGFDASDFLLGETNESPRKFFGLYPMAPTPETGPHSVVHGKFKAHFYSSGTPASGAGNYADDLCIPALQPIEHNPPLVYDLSVDPGERFNIVNDSSVGDALDAITAWRTEHMASMTWAPSVTNVHEERSQPCCTDRNCDNFPACCDCPAADTSPATSACQT